MWTPVEVRGLAVWRRSAVPVLAAAAALMFLLGASSVSGSHADVRLLAPSPALLGTWRAPGDGIVKVVIRRDRPGRVKLAVFGACVPTPCSWGTVTARLFASDARASLGTGLRASYDNDFALATVTAHLLAGTRPSLHVEDFDRFIDGSGRSDYCSSVDMHRN
jgi:hypothetical protein